MAKVTLDNLATTLANSAAPNINVNNDRLEAAFENTLSRDGTGPNQMLADFDMNNNDLINVDNLDANVIVLNGSVLVPGGVTEIPPESIPAAMLGPGSVTEPKLSLGVANQLVFRTDTRTSLKAIDTTRYFAALLAEAGREGLFKWTTGDFSTQITGDTLEGIYIKANAIASTAGAWVRVVDGDIDVRWFGATVNGTTDDSTAINKALEFSASSGRTAYQPVGTSAVGSTIVLKDGAKWAGADMYNTTVKRIAGHTGALVKTENFDALTGTGDAFVAGVPEFVSISGITFDGNYQNTARTVYNQSTGQGLRLFCRKLNLIARVFNTPGIGVWTECPGGNGPVPLQPGFSREAKVNLYVHQTQYEGVVWKGPPDTQIESILQADAGSRIVADEGNGKVNSPTYGGVNGAQTFGVVFDGLGAEVGTIHAFGNLGGGGIDWRNGGRINANLMMAESCNFGGIRISGAASGIISKLDVHRTGGFSGDTTSDLIYAGTGNNNYGLEIGVCSLYRQNAAHTGARNYLEITGDFLDIGLLKIEGGSTANAGHGVYVTADTASWISIRGGEIARCKGTAPDALASSAVFRTTTGTGSNFKIDASVRDCDVAFRSTGTPRIETIDLDFFLAAGQLAFAGDARTQLCQEWNIRGTIDGVAKSSKLMTVTAAFDSSITTEQSLNTAHNLIYTPPFGKYHCTGLFDTPTDMSTGDVGYIEITAADATNLTVIFKMATADAVNTAPRVGLIAEI